MTRSAFRFSGSTFYEYLRGTPLKNRPLGKESRSRKIVRRGAELNAFRVSNFRSACHNIRLERVARKTFQGESYLDKQVDRLTDAEWLAPPSLSASTTQTLYPRHSWSVSERLPVICNSLFSSFFALVITSPFPSSCLSLSLSLSLSPQLRIPRTSHSFPPRSSESGASRDLRRNLLRFEKLTTDGSHVINLVTLSPGRARKIENCVVVEAVEEKLENLKRWLDGRFWRLLNTWAFDACVNVRVDVSSSPGMGS